MKPYLEKALWQFNNLTPSKKQHAPYPHVCPKFGPNAKFAEYHTFAPVGKEEQMHVQKVNGKFLWYGRAIDDTLLTPFSALTEQQSKPTK